MIKFLWPTLLFSLMLVAGCGSKGGETEPVVPALDLKEVPRIKLLKSVWRAKSEENLMPASARPLLYDSGQVVVSIKTGMLNALDAQTGKSLWDIQVSDDDILANYGFGRFFVSTRSGEVVALNSEGEQLWRHRTRRELLSPPQSDGNVVLVHAGSAELIALDFITGEERWVYRHEKPGLVVRGDAPPLLRQGVAVLGLASGGVALHNPDTGMQLGKFQIASSTGGNELQQLVDVDHPPILLKETMVVSAYQYKTRAVDMQRGTIVWEKDFGVPEGVVQTGDGDIVLTTDNGDVVMISIVSGDILWRIEGLAEYQPARPIVIEDVVIVPLREAREFLFIDRVQGNLVGRQAMGANKAPVVALNVSDAALYTIDDSGSVVHWQMLNAR